MPQRRDVGSLPVALLLLLFNAATARADDFTDFRIPAHRVFSWQGDIEADVFGARATGDSQDSRSSDRRLNTMSNVYWIWDSDPAFTQISIAAGARGTRKQDLNQLQFADSLSRRSDRDELRAREVNEHWLIALTHRRYPWANPIGFSIDLDATGGYTQQWENQDHERFLMFPGTTASESDREHSQRWTYATQVIGGADAGLGRVRDATAVFDERVLEDRLRRAGALIRPLSPAARRRLAALLSTRGAFDSVHDRPGPSLWREIERILGEDGALREGGLDAWSVLRSAQPIGPGAVSSLERDGVPRSPVLRLSGGFVGVRIEESHAHFVDREDLGEVFEDILNGSVFRDTTRLARHTTGTLDQVLGGITGEYHRALGLRWQLDGASTVMTSLRRQGKVLWLQSSGNLSFLIADRWLGTGSVSQQWVDMDRTKGATPDDRWFWDYGVTLAYYLEDRVTIQAQASGNQAWIRGDATAPPGFGRSTYRRSGGVSLGLSYRFAGEFHAPGLFPGGGAIDSP